MRAIQPGRECQLSGPIAAQADNDYLIRETTEDLTGESRLAHSVANCGQTRVNVQLAAVIAVLVMAREVYIQIAERLIFFLPQRHAHHVLGGEPVGLSLLALEEQIADGR
jgi:hypothetical protein